MKYPVEPGANVLYFISWLKFSATLTSARKVNEVQAFVLGPPFAGFALLPSRTSLIPDVRLLSLKYVSYPLCTSLLPACLLQLHTLVGNQIWVLSLSNSQAHKGESRLCFLDVKRGLAFFVGKLKKITSSPSLLLPMLGIKRRNYCFSNHIHGDWNLHGRGLWAVFHLFSLEDKVLLLQSQESFKRMSQTFARWTGSQSSFLVNSIYLTELSFWILM